MVEAAEEGEHWLRGGAESRMAGWMFGGGYITDRGSGDRVGAYAAGCKLGAGCREARDLTWAIGQWMMTVAAGRRDGVLELEQRCVREMHGEGPACQPKGCGRGPARYMQVGRYSVLGIRTRKPTPCPNSNSIDVSRRSLPRLGRLVNQSDCCLDQPRHVNNPVGDRGGVGCRFFIC